MGTLDILDQWREQEERVLKIYEDALAACSYINPPTIELSQFDKVPIARGMAACYINSHEIFVDFAWASQATDAELAGCLAHELAHGVAGVRESHGRAFQAVEREIIDRMRCHGMVVETAPDQARLGPAKQPQPKFWNRIETFLMFAPVFAIVVITAIHLVGRAGHA